MQLESANSSGFVTNEPRSSNNNSIKEIFGEIQTKRPAVEKLSKKEAREIERLN
jgi:hypothetical protein